MNALIKKYLTGSDTFVRHLCLADLARAFSPASILDAGGEGYLKLFVKAKTTSINVKSADVRYSGVRLPFKDGSFDVAVSCDTLEHIHKKERGTFIDELARVCRKGVVLCAPLGTAEHIEAEKAVALLPGLDATVKAYLDEHIAYGLPTPEEVAGFAGERGGSVYYQGDFRRVASGSSSRIVGYARAAFAAPFNLLLELHGSKRLLAGVYAGYTNRFFMKIDKRS